MTNGDKIEPLAVRPREAAQMLGMTEHAVRGMVARGQLPAYRWGRRVLILPADLQECLRNLEPVRRA
jgi:excisionase family DNA binding protein